MVPAGLRRAGSRTVFGPLAGGGRRYPPAVPDPVVLRTSGGWIAASDPVEVVAASGLGAFAALSGLTPGWWAGYLSYDLGRAVERVCPRLPDDLGLPDLLLARYDARAVVGPSGRRIDA